MHAHSNSSCESTRKTHEFPLNIWILIFLNTPSETLALSAGFPHPPGLRLAWIGRDGKVRSSLGVYVRSTAASKRGMHDFLRDALGACIRPEFIENAYGFAL
jgi:hypothetical protein